MRQASDASAGAANEDSTSSSPAGAELLRFPSFRKDFIEASDSGELRRFVGMLGQAPAFMAVLRGRDHVLEFVNAAYFQLVGHRDIVGKSVYDAFPEVRNQGFQVLLDAVYESGIPFIGDETPIMLQRTPEAPAELRFINFVYQPILNDDGSVNGIFAHGADVTELVLARQKSDELVETIAQQARAHDAMLSSIKDFVYCFDRSGRFIYANNPLLELLGLSLGQIVGKTFLDLPYPRILATALQANIDRVVATGETLRDETPYTSPSGRSGHYEYIFVPIFNPDGRVEQVAGSTHEVTHYKQVEQQKDEFIAIASHELKTPLTSIKAYAQILQRRFVKEQHEVAAELLAKMNTQLDRLTGLIGDLLDTTHIVSGKLLLTVEPFDFQELARDVVEEMQRTTSRHRLLQSFAPPVRIFADRDRVRQVMTNIISNAIKYSPNADSIEISTSSDDREVIFRVRDYGQGLSTEIHDHVFDRFYRGEEADTESIPGLGLGLYISSEIISRLHGRIWNENHPFPGTTFGFSLPLVQPRENRHNDE